MDQLKAITKLPNIAKVVGMPDLHPGTGYPIGAAFFSTQRFYPALIGGDIGCGMAFWQTDITIAKLHLNKLEKRLGSIDLPLDEEIIEANLPEQLRQNQFVSSLGTIGLGNHFAEFQQVDTLYEAEITDQLGLNKKALQLLVHSGSRGFGGTIGRSHVDQFGHHGLDDDTEYAQAYLTQQQLALEYATLNRQLIAQRILSKVKATGVPLLDLFHNFIEQKQIEGMNGWLHRKGAAPADKGLAIIPGSRGDYSYLVQPIATKDSLYSLAHGAGRKWIRTDCKGRLKNHYTVDQLTRSHFNSRFICDNRELIYEEAPQAYKSIETVIDSLVQAKIIKVLARLKPVLTYKTLKEKI
ncbi:RNA ligase RtcB family protein [Neisseria sp. Ec49-e6-T10]|uniref:RNA ligase RtcB family protein n=1 Tax=Neisseria sp. Ec49-e6-T10 TaxID=3140744 RepID=UPI003EB6C27F